MSGMLKNLRTRIWQFRKKFPMLNGFYETIRKRRFPIFLEYPIQPELRYGHGKKPHERIMVILRGNDAVYEQHLKEISALKADFLDIEMNAPESSTNPFWNNQHMPNLDAMALYMFLVKLKPRNYVEIGSGNSTKFAKRAITRHQLATKITSIDPHPRASINDISDHVVRKELKNADLSIFEKMEAGDIVFFDGSHLLFQGSDVTIFFLEILHSLKKDVWVHIHDINWPDDYQYSDADRFLNEQYVLAAYLLGGGGNLEIQLPNYYIWKYSSLVDNLSPIFTNPKFADHPPNGASIWFKVS
jgi:hypothetical protein